MTHSLQMIGYGWWRVPEPVGRDLSSEEVRQTLERQLAWTGDDQLTLGEVSEADKDTITAEIETADGSLVDRLKINRHTGLTQHLN